jgi:hypothetical protein
MGTKPGTKPGAKPGVKPRGNLRAMARALTTLLALGGPGLLLTACEHGADAMTPAKLEQQYGISGARTEDVSSPEGQIRGTIVPVTLADGRKAQLFVPERQRTDPHGVYLRDDDGLHPVRVHEAATRDEVARAPAIVSRLPEPQHKQKHSWEKDALIVGGSAGAGTAIGAVAGGGKGAAIGATAGGIGGLIYDLATRHKP